MRVPLLIALLVAACQHPAPPRPTAVPPTPSVPIFIIPGCPRGLTTGIMPTLCAGSFTPEGYACFLCPGLADCVDDAHKIYCQSGMCGTDPACSAVLPYGAPRSPSRSGGLR